jgi:hypothetical protein
MNAMVEQTFLKRHLSPALSSTFCGGEGDKSTRGKHSDLGLSKCAQNRSGQTRSNQVKPVLLKAEMLKPET